MASNAISHTIFSSLCVLSRDQTKRYSNKIAPELCERSIDLSMCVNGRTRRSPLCLFLFTRHNQFCWIHTTATAHCYVLADVDFTSFGLVVIVTEVASVRTKLLPH